MGAKGDGGKKGPDWGQIFSWAANFAAHSWTALKDVYLVIKPMIDLIKGVIGIAIDVFNFVKDKLAWIYDFYKDWVKPWIDWVRGALEIVQATMLVVQGRIEEFIKVVYTDLFGDIEKIRADVLSMFDKVEDIISIFSEETAAKLQVFEDKLFMTLDKYTRDIRDELIGKLHEVTDPVLHKINEITLVIEGYLKPIASRFETIEKLINITFEKPQLLRRETLKITGLSYGMDLWNATFEGSTPALTEEEAAPFPFAMVPEWMQKAQENIIKGREGEWSDVEKRIEEELQEIITGEEVEAKTEIVVPELAELMEESRKIMPRY